MNEGWAWHVDERNSNSRKMVEVMGMLMIVMMAAACVG